MLPGVVSVAAQRRLSPLVCDWLFCTGEAFDATTAHQLGLADCVGSAKAIETEAARLEELLCLHTTSVSAPRPHQCTDWPFSKVRFEVDGSQMVARLAVPASMEFELICEGFTALVASAQCQSLRVVVLHIDGAKPQQDEGMVLSDDAIAQLEVAVESLTSRGIVIMCSVRGHMALDRLHLCACAHYRIVDAQATFDIARRECQCLLCPEDAQTIAMHEACGLGWIFAPVLLDLGFASEVLDTGAEARTLRFAKWLTRQSPVGLKYMLRLTFFSRSSVFGGRSEVANPRPNSRPH